MKGDPRRAWMLLAGVLLAHGISMAVLNVHADSPEDEEVYAAQTHLLAAGHVPYRDFFQAHPPGLMVLALGPYELGGLRGLRLFAWMAGAAALTLLFVIVSRQLGPAWATVACVLVLLSPSWQRYGGGRTLELRAVANVPLLAGLYLLLAGTRRRSAVLAGALFGGAAMIVLAAVPHLVAGGLALLLAVRRLPDARRHLTRPALALGSAVATAAVLLGTLVWVVPEAWGQVIGFQLQRGGMAVPLDEKLALLGSLAWRDPLLAVLGALGVVLAPDRITRGLAAWGLLAVLLAYGTAAVAHPHYVVPALPLLAIGAAGVAARAFGSRWPRAVGVPLVTGAVAVVLVVQLPVTAGALRGLPTADYARAVAAVRAAGGPVWSTKPIYALDAGVPLVPWFFAADSRALLNAPAQAYQLSAEAYRHAMDEARTIVWGDRTAWTVPEPAQSHARTVFPTIVYESPLATVRTR